MKRFTLALLLLCRMITFAQDGINYKALITDNLGVPVASQSIDVRFTIIADTQPRPTNVYLETHTGAPTDANGIVILTIGEGSVLTGVFTDIAWGDDTHSLKVEVDIEQDNSFVDIGTTQFMSVPYALQANTATTATELTGGIDQAYIDALEAQITLLESQTEARVGDLRACGVVFWVDPADNRHGLVCAMSDYVSTRQWGCYDSDLASVPNVTIGPTGPGAEIGDGMTNTNAILTDCSTAPAALAARSYGPEWFLPSAKELNEMYVNKATLEEVPGFIPMTSFYWSSTEFNNFYAWYLNFDNGNSIFNVKTNPGNVRAVRAF